MDIRECYAAFGGNYDDVFARLMTDDRINKFLRLFLMDESFDQLCNAMQSQDYATAFRAAHTLKGTCLNLGITRLANSASAITEALRGDVNNGADVLLPTVISDYALTVKAIKQLD